MSMATHWSFAKISCHCKCYWSLTVFQASNIGSHQIVHNVHIKSYRIIHHVHIKSYRIIHHMLHRISPDNSPHHTPNPYRSFPLVPQTPTCLNFLLVNQLVYIWLVCVNNWSWHGVLLQLLSTHGPSKVLSTQVVLLTSKFSLSILQWLG